MHPAWRMMSLKGVPFIIWTAVKASCSLANRTQATFLDLPNSVPSFQHPNRSRKFNFQFCWLNMMCKDKIGESSVKTEAYSTSVVSTWIQHLALTDCCFTYPLTRHSTRHPACLFEVIFEILPCDFTLQAAHLHHLPRMFWSRLVTILVAPKSIPILLGTFRQQKCVFWLAARHLVSPKTMDLPPPFP